MSTTAQPRGRGRAQVDAVVTELPQPAPARPEGSQLAAAILAIQEEAPKLSRNAIGQVGPRQYRYVDLDAVLDAIVPLYVRHQVSFRAMPCRDDHGEPAIRYRLTHIPSGEYDEDVMPLMMANPDPQGQGSAITYARRYVQLAVLNLAPGDDDDGAAASEPVRTFNTPAATASPAPAPAATSGPSSGGTRPVSVAQAKMLHAKARDARLTQSQFADILLVAGGYEARNMDEPAAGRWLKMGVDRFPGRHPRRRWSCSRLHGPSGRPCSRTSPPVRSPWRRSRRPW